MRDMLPRKPTTTLAVIKKGLKDSSYGNGMSSVSPLISPAPSGESSSPAQDLNEATSNYPSMPKPLTPSITAGAIASPLSSPGIRAKTSPKHKLRRNQSMDSKKKNQLFDFDGNTTENNYCANNNNNSKLTRRHSMKPDDHTRRTPSRNSISDELSSSSLTPTTDEQTNSAGGQNLELNSIFDNVDDEMFNKVLKNIEKAPDDPLGLPDDLPEFDAVVSSFQNSTDGLLFESNPLRTTQTGDLPSLEGLSNSPLSPRQQLYSSTVTSATNSTSAQRILQLSMVPSASSPASATRSSSSESAQKKSHLLDILGVTDTIRLKTMSRAIDTVPYKSPMTTTSYSTTGMKLISNTPAISCTMASRSRLPSNMSFSNKPPRPQYMFNPENPMFRPNLQGFMDNGANGPWSRASPRHVHPNLLKSPSFSGSFVETSMNPSLVNPMSGLQNTVDSIPAAPVGTSDPGTPMMGPPLRSPRGFEAATPSPGGGRMRPPPSPSVMNDKQCADSVSSSNGGKKTGNKRERTRSTDSKEDEKKETSAPKNKRRKSRSKDENVTGKKESKTSGRSSKDEKTQRHDSALSGLLDVQKSDPYMYVFNTDIANRAAAEVNKSKVPHIILFHQAFLGNCQLHPSDHFKPKTTSSEQMSDLTNMSMPTTCRSPTEMPVVKFEPILHESPRISPPHSNLENVQAINLQDTKLPLLPAADLMNSNENPSVNEPITSQPIMTSQNGSQEELSAEKRRHREDKLDKLRKMQEKLFLQENQEGPNTGNVMPRGPACPAPHPHQPGLMHYVPMPGMPMDNRPPGMKDIPIPADVMMSPGGQPITQENAEWHRLIQEHNAERLRQQGPGVRGQLPSRPPPPYGMNGPQHRWMGPEGYQVEARMPMDPMNHPRLQRVGSGHRQLVRMPQDPRIPGGYMPPRMIISRVPYPPNQQQRMPMYEPYMGPTGMRHPSRLPHPSHPNYPFSEKLMKQASYYNTNMSPCDPELQMAGEWASGEGPQRIPHVPGSTSPAMGPQGMINSVEMNHRMTPGMPTRGYEQHMGSYHPEMEERFDVLPMGSPPGPMESRMQGPSGASMMDAIARRGVQRPPDLNLNNQILPRSPMNYHGHGPMPSPSVNAMNQPIGPRYCNLGEMGHLPHPSPMHTRSPHMVMSQPSLSMGPASAGIEPPPQMMLGPQMGGPPHSAGPLSNPHPNEWSGHILNMPPGAHTPNSGMMHLGNMVQSGSSMSSQASMMSSQPGMMSMQPGMMSPGMQQPQPGRMMTSPGMMSQSLMMTSQSQGVPRMPSAPSSLKHGTNMLSIMRERMSMYKLPEKTPLYQDAVKDTSPPTLNHPNDVQRMTHNPMSVVMRMPAPNHPQSVPYDTRMGPPRMSVPHHHINQNFQPGFPGDGHPSPMSGHPMSTQGGNGMMMNMGGHEPVGPLPADYQQQPIRNFSEMEFDLRNILPSERPSQTISYLPPASSNDQFTSPGWGNDGIRPQPYLMPGPTHPPNRPPML